MGRETMNPSERLWAAIRVEKPDRVPVMPVMNPEPAAYLTGLTMAQVASSTQVAMDAILKVFDEYGGWDVLAPMVYKPVQMQAANFYPMKMRIPGRDLPEDHMFQLVEEEIMKPEDYNKICEMGMDRFYYEDYLWRISDLKPEDLPKEIEDLTASVARLVMEAGKRGLQSLVGSFDMHPFFRLSLMRSMVPFTQDLYFNPEPVERTLKHMTAELISTHLKRVKESGASSWAIVEERASAFFYPLSVFERFWWPYTLEIIDAFWSEGVVTMFHLDQCWDKNIPYFKKLPKGSAVLQLDSLTDIFRAKEIVRGHLCLYGDVSATLMSIGKPEDVEAYCKKLIDEVGGDGGFILSNGCSMPPNPKPENVRAMIDTGKNYEFSKK